MTDNPPVSFADSPLCTRGPNYGFRTSDQRHWFGMTVFLTSFYRFLFANADSNGNLPMMYS